MTIQDETTTTAGITTAYGVPLEQRRPIGRSLVAGAAVLGGLALLHAPLFLMLLGLVVLGLVLLRR